MGDLTEVQERLLELLHVFVDVCDQNGLRYFLVGGSALGAVRHRGFIPWDDDIDVAMPRPDFVKLCVERSVSLPAGFRTFNSDSLLFGGIENSSVQVTHGNAAWDEQQSLLSIDIFPIDGTPNNRVLRQTHINKCLALFALIKLKRIGYIQQTESLKNRTSRPKAEQLLIKYGKYIQPALSCVSEHSLLRALDAAMSRYPYDESSVVGSYTGRYRKKEFFDRTTFEEGRKCRFEDLEIKVYRKVEQYLRTIYGVDYMSVPVQSARERHGDLRILSQHNMHAAAGDGA